jgi:hypothetical protein
MDTHQNKHKPALQLSDFKTAIRLNPRSFMKLGPGLSFSWKRAFGVTKARRSIARATGIPTSRSGRRNKLGRWMGMK